LPSGATPRHASRTAILRSAHQKRRVALAELMQPSERELGVIEEEEELLD